MSRNLVSLSTLAFIEDTVTFIWVPVGELVTYMVSSPDEPMGVRVRLEQLDNIMSLFTMPGFVYKMTRITYGYNLCILYS